MKIKYLFALSVIAMVFASCAKVAQPDQSQLIDTPTPTGVNPSTVPYSIVESFEYGTKTSYADANVTLLTGSWDFNDALIGNLSNDAKDGSFSARVRTGSLGMNFDISNLKTLYISHALYGSDAATTWQLMASTDGGTTYTQLGNTINETSTTLVVDSFKVSTTGKIRFKIVKTSTTRINIDDITFKGIGDPGITVSVPPSSPVDTASTGTAAAARAALYGSDAPPANGDNSNLLFGNPSNAATISNDNYLFDQHYYVESYNATRAEPNWVSWHLDASNTTNAQGRLDNFAAFSGLLAGMYAVQSNSYSGSGFDRGHNCPSADRTSSFNANAATFLMTNMIPQAPNNNQQTWGNLENYLRSLTSSGYEVYIIMGSYGSGGTGSLGGTTTSINNGHIAVPSNVWKVAVILPVGNGDLARVSSSTRVLSVNTPNVNSINSDWKKYIVTMKSIEDATGYKILSALPASVHDALAVKTDPGS
ncbi:endonuclease [Mucilaginibacter sp. PPCGB 2223]|uniref:DNA/RNA non-specific endonuclease n=1 Tax=Mucilaginibacter sp. PPCGB 2223 TaxID=1886027 RepID=UPI0008267E60|nr:DNA/RNA non-specific endonuclease [Mucilaginibacter sp. PPCGB 2223]OCX50444.1 endonuclease [Mucilaginibacter sp. PPCGB 2223]